MGFFKRLFSADYRAAVTAEAAGDLDLAAERYALAGQLDAAVRVHMARASRADTRADEIAALHDALHWAEPDTPAYARASRALGNAMLARSRAEGIATARDRDRVREAAELLCEAGDFAVAAEALESIGDERRAADAYRRGGFIDKMEAILVREARRSESARALREAFGRYELAHRGGDRDGARAALRECVEVADEPGEYRRLLDELESRLITGGHLILRPRKGHRLAVSARSHLWIGRDPLCDLALRAGSVSRRHAHITLEESGGEPAFVLRDGGSRGGTLLGGLPITGAVPLTGAGELSLGEDCPLGYEVGGDPPVLSVRVEGGLDAGSRLLCAPEGAPIPLAPLAPGAVTMRGGRPVFRRSGDGALRLNGEPLARGDVQLIHGDELFIDGVEVDVE